MPNEVTKVTEEMELSQFFPDLNGIQDTMTTLMRILVILGPVLMLLLGLYYFFLSPKEANYKAGYRFRYAMSQVGVWQFTQRFAGLVYGSTGLVLSLVMLILMIGFSDMNVPNMVWHAVKCLLWQIIFVMVATLGVNIYVMVKFDPKGNPRVPKGKKKAARPRTRK